MDPQIQYVTTADGVTLACYTAGRGVPFLMLDLPFAHATAQLATAQGREQVAQIARAGMLVHYDPRGFGLSDRSVRDFSLDSMVRDIEAVAGHFGLEPFELVAANAVTTPIAVAYATRHPQRLRHLMLIAGFARVPAAFHEQVSGLLDKHEGDWRFVSEALVRIVQGWDDHEASGISATLLRESISFEGFRALWRALSDWDVTDLLASVTVPTLTIHLRDHAVFGPDKGRDLASRIPGAVAAIISGEADRGRRREYLAAIAAFLGYQGAVPEVDPVSPQGTAIILFTDIVDSTAMTEQIGDVAFRAKARDLDKAMREAIRAEGGTAIEGKLLGDGVLAVFLSAREAIEAARRCNAASGALGLKLHLGIHAGDVIREGDNVYGGAVNLASRIASASVAGEILVSDTVRALARTSAGATFVDRGEHDLKGIEEPVRLYAVQ